MLKKILKLVKRIVLVCLLLYGYNVLAAPLGYIIPVNILTVLFITALGTPALLSFIVLMIFVF